MSKDNNKKDAINNIFDSSNYLNSFNNNINIINSINNLFINDSNNSNQNNKEDDNFINNISSNSNLISSKSTEHSSIIDLDDNNKIFDYLYENIKENKIKNSIIVLKDEEESKIVYEKIINNFCNKNRGNEKKNKKKICFLILDLKKLEKLSEELKLIFKDKKISILKGGKGKKVKNNLETFNIFFEESDIFVAIPDVFYKFLSTGFIKIYYFSLLFLEDCHLCEGNHPYNNIMQEFYFYYLYRHLVLKIKIDFPLPNIIGFTDSPLLYEKIMNKDDKTNKLLTNLSENLNCQIVVSPKIIYNNKSISYNEIDVNIEYILVNNHLGNENIDTIYQILNHYFIEKALPLSLKNYISQNNQKTFDAKELKSISKNYLDIIHKKFYAKDKEEYTKIEVLQKNYNYLSKGSHLFKIFEDILKYLLLIFQNLDTNEIINLFSKYLFLLQNLATSQGDKLENIKINIKEIKYLAGIINESKNTFQFLLNKDVKYNNDRNIKFLSKLEIIFKNDKNAKILIFVPSRKLAFLLNELLDRYKYNSEYLTGINTKKEEYFNISLLTKTTYNIINEINQKYDSNIINILVCTPPMIDVLQINKCDYIIIFKELSNLNFDYFKIKKLVMNKGAKLIIFSTNPNDIKTIFKEETKFDNKSSINFENNGIVRDLRRNNFFKEKFELIENINYYFIEETHAKVSIKNSLMLFNDINNWYITKNQKIVVNKLMDEIVIGKIKKYKCKIELDKIFGETKIFSQICGDKQTAEGECFLQLIIFLHKYGLIDNNFKIIDSP